MAEQVRVTFQFRRGTQVRYEGQAWEVVSQRAMIRNVLGPVIEYLLWREGRTARWASEADLCPDDDGGSNADGI